MIHTLDHECANEEFKVGFEEHLVVSAVEDLGVLFADGGGDFVEGGFRGCGIDGIHDNKMIERGLGTLRANFWASQDGE